MNKLEKVRHVELKAVFYIIATQNVIFVNVKSPQLLLNTPKTQ